MGRNGEARWVGCPQIAEIHVSYGLGLHSPYAIESRFPQAARNGPKRNRLVKDFQSRQAKHARRSTGMQAGTQNAHARAQLKHKELGPRPDHFWRIVIHEHDIDAAIGQHPMRIFTRGTASGLTPKTKEVGSQPRRHGKFAIHHRDCVRISIRTHQNLKAACRLPITIVSLPLLCRIIPPESTR